MYYIAYGSNLNVEQMKYRCRDAKKVGSSVLKGYKLVFDLHLTVEKEKGAETPIGIWDVSNNDIHFLDVYEGYPTYYKKKHITLKINGKKHKALIYIMDKRNNIPQVPAYSYYITCLQGYKDFGLDVSILNKALAEVRNFKRDNSESVDSASQRSSRH